MRKAFILILVLINITILPVLSIDSVTAHAAATDTVTLSIYSYLDNTYLLNEVTLPYVTGDTPLKVLLRYDRVEAEVLNGYVRSIYSLGEKQNGKYSGWIYRVDGELIRNQGAAQYKLTAGQSVKWEYAITAEQAGIKTASSSEKPSSAGTNSAASVSASKGDSAASVKPGGVVSVSSGSSGADISNSKVAQAQSSADVSEHNDLAATDTDCDSSDTDTAENSYEIDELAGTGVADDITLKDKNSVSVLYIILPLSVVCIAGIIYIIKKKKTSNEEEID